MTTLLIILGYIIGRTHFYYERRVQCVNCGKHKTRELASGYGGEGGICGFAVKHWEGHICKDCGEITSVKMSLSKKATDYDRTPTMKKVARELIFISQIERDGSGTIPVPQSYLDSMLTNTFMKDEPFYVRRLSITENTYIAMGFNSFVVRLKADIDEQKTNGN